ncbi:monovalent cation/H(+) antiporter subunit G [Paenibacillus sp. TRM 82003]|uniref:monovalent cation/H(+) antiporter subunit G n=1 Tax=Kineococcus sp. TRM81007 TaxID=2925831 RepID=UPI001F582B1B|nr:monovalent cation/H(+) antiporter subunit G [Kineococcus sp. TRM81007]MCI2238313.1 monovalent cation/H(+) antiporter subunit G [Kineococcus sp. TRM81007]MCI3924015.1 monovalent cation/H(+) antiporter subunit G [Paenibacillus sp. TRM 82003]
MSAVLDVVSGVLVVLGALLAVTAGVGLVRFGDLWLRMHAGTKPQVAGLLLVLAGCALQFTHRVGVIASLLLVAFFQVLTAPVSAHVLARAGHRSGAVPRDGLVHDDLARAVGGAGAGEDDADDPDDPDGPVGDAPGR